MKKSTSKMDKRDQDKGLCYAKPSMLQINRCLPVNVIPGPAFLCWAPLSGGHSHFKLRTSFGVASCQMAAGGAEHALHVPDYLLTEIYWSEDCQQSWCNVPETAILSRDIQQVKIHALLWIQAVSVLIYLAQLAALPCSVLSSLSEINPVHVHQSYGIWRTVSEVAGSNSNMSRTVCPAPCSWRFCWGIQ